MSPAQMRKAIENVYLGKAWKEKVAKMKDNQVAAIYQKFKDEKRIK